MRRRVLSTVQTDCPGGNTDYLKEDLNVSKISFEKKKDKITIINRLSYPEAVNERVYNAILSGMFEGLLPVCIKQKRKEIRIECVIQGLIPITQYFDGVVTKKAFLDFVHAIALQIKECEKNMINANNLDLQNDKIFIDPLTKKVKCIFWPIVNNQRDNPPYLFLKQLPFELNFGLRGDNEYLETYKSFFNELTPFSVNSFDRMILRLSGKSDTGGRVVPSGALADKFRDEKSSEMNKSEEGKGMRIEYNPFIADNCDKENDSELPSISEPKYAFCTSCGAKNQAGSNFCIRCGTRLYWKSKVEIDTSPQKEVIDPGTTVLGDNFGGTTVLGFDEPDEPTFPVLIREKNEESFSVDKPVFRIGTEQKYCDLFIRDNNYISRSHADIVTRDDRYYIIDRNSTNRTFVDGKVIPAEKEVEIFPGTKIRLANEDFTFNIES